MNSGSTLWAEVDERGRLVLPPEAVDHFGLKPGARVRLDEDGNNIRVHRPVTQLTKVYVEPTTRCNIDCRMCIRSGWNERLEHMSGDTFAHLLDGLRDFSPVPTVFFGGWGEPLFHPLTVDWIAQAKSIGARVELITNGTLMTERLSQQIIDAGLDVLWVSIDGATPESYADVRLGAELPNVVANLARFRKMRRGSHFPTPKIGIAFVAMKRNIDELPEVLKIGRRIGATLFSVSNLLPYTEAMQKDVLYSGVVRNIAYLSAPNLPKLSLPKMDLDELTREAFFAALDSGYNVNFAGNSLGGANDVCNFIESGTMSIAWDGNVSPCWSLLHDHVSYLHGKPRRMRRHIIGNVNERRLTDVWQDPEYVAYRTRVQSFVFAPCTFCGGCDLSEANCEDCIGNTFPACGGCLWAQGVIQCP